MKHLKIVTLLISIAFLSSPHAPCLETEKKRENPSEIQETILGDTVADALRTALGADLALINAGSLGSDPDPKKISNETLRDVIPFDGEPVVKIEITGENLLKALERSVSLLPKRFSGFLQVSGVTFTCDPSGKPDERVSAARVNGAPLKSDAKYSVATTGFLAGGGGGYTSLKNGKTLSDKPRQLGEIVLKHADTSKSAKSSGRITFKKPEKK